MEENVTLRTLSPGAAVSDGDLFISRQGADTVDKSVTAAQLKTFAQGSFTAGSVIFSNGTNLSQDNANLFWDDTNNRLGIGTSSPNTKLQVAGGDIKLDYNQSLVGRNFANDADRVLVQYTGNPGVVQIGSGLEGGVRAMFASGHTFQLQNATTARTFDIWEQNNSIWRFRASDANTSISFWPSGAEAFRLTSSGNAVLGIQEDGTSPTGNTLRGPRGSGTNIAGGALTLAGGPGTGTGGGGSLIFQTAPAGSSGAAQNTLATAMTITNAGNVGIGTTSPSTALHVAGGVRSDTSFSVERAATIASPTVNGLVLGAVGGSSGLFSPSLYFDVGGGGGGAKLYTSRIGSAGGRLYINTDDTSGVSQTRLFINESGNVGIGRTNPQNLLHVDGPSGATVSITNGNWGWWNITSSSSSNAGTLQFHSNNSGRVPLTLDGASGNVGIGTTSPGAKLDITGTADQVQLRVRSFTSQGPYIAEFYGPSNNVQLGINSTGGIERPTAGDLVISNTSVNNINFNTNGAERVRFTGSGNVGIGTTSPQAKLSLGSDVTAQKLLVYDSGNVRYGMGIQSSEFRKFIPSGPTNFFSFGTVSTTDGSTYTELMRLNGSGNVGIGTTSPTLGKLQVNAASGTSSLLALATDSATAGNYPAMSFQAGNSPISGASVIAQQRFNIFNGLPQEVARIEAYTSGSNAGIFHGSLHFYTQEATGSGLVTLSEKMRIANNGNVGIGTTSPSQALDVAGNIRNTAQYLGNSGSASNPTYSFSSSANTGMFRNGTNVSFAAAGSLVMDITTSGRVGIGTSSPASLLDVNGEARASVFRIPTPSGAGSPDVIFGTSPHAPFISATDNGNDASTQLQLYTATLGSIYVQGGAEINLTAAKTHMSGNVGIGTTSPGALLDVGLAGTTLGTFRLAGNTSGFTQIQPSAAAGSWTLTLPDSAGTSGRVLKTNGSGVASWGDTESVPVYATTRWYTGQKTGNISTSALSASSSRLYLMPIYISRSTTFTDIGIYVSAGGTATAFRMGIYSGYPAIGANVTLVSGTDVEQTTITAAAVNSRTFASPVTLEPGWYCLAIYPNGSLTVNVMPASNTLGMSLGLTDLNTEGPRIGKTGQTYGALSGTLTGIEITNDGTSTPMLGIRVQ